MKQTIKQRCKMDWAPDGLYDWQVEELMRPRTRASKGKRQKKTGCLAGRNVIWQVEAEEAKRGNHIAGVGKLVCQAVGLLIGLLAGAAVWYMMCVAFFAGV